MPAAMRDIFVISDLHLGDGGVRDKFEPGGRTRQLHAFLDYVESALRVSVDSAAVGPRNWQFSQAGGQGCYLWDVHYSLE